jgi:hypothetical protein
LPVVAGRVVKGSWRQVLGRKLIGWLRLVSDPGEGGGRKQNAVGWEATTAALFRLGRRSLSGYSFSVNVRVILLSLLFSLLLTQGTCRADGASNLSRKASVIMPLLNQISPMDPPQEVFERVKKILGGEPDSGESGGPIGRFWTAEWYFLDDKTEVDVAYLNGRFSGISIRLPGQQWKVLYKAPKAGN